jgi:DNA repair protein RecO (recombination protein O)
VNEFSVVRPHRILREDLDRIALASTAVEAVSLGAEEGEPSPDLYHLLTESLDLLEGAARPAVVLQGFLLHALRLLGYLPEFSECVRCRRPAAPKAEAFLSPEHGGLVCANCRPGTPDASSISPEALGFLRGASGTALRLMDRIPLASPIVQEVSEALQASLRHILGRPLRSAGFLDRL